MALIELVAWAVSLPVSAMLAWLALEVLAGLRASSVNGSAGDARLTVIVPARDESAGIAAMLSDLANHIAPQHILVVADNCTDNTAAIARQADAIVAERTDLSRIGKGHALAFARDILAGNPPDAVMILDADCRIAHGELQALASRAVACGTPVQALNLQVAPTGATPLVQLGAFAFLVKNLVRTRGLERIGGSTVVQGTGTVYPWPVFARLDLASDNPVEDIETALELAGAGVAVRFDPACRVASLSPHEAGHLAQRHRWEHGSIRSIGSGLGLLVRGARNRSLMQVAIGAHFAVPPMALLGLMTGLTLLVTALLAVASLTSWSPFSLVGGASLIAGAAIAAAWWKEGRETIGLSGLLLAPAYVVWKLPIYLGLLRGERREWNRAQRDVSPDRPG